jgi:hypothetical protein
VILTEPGKNPFVDPLHGRRRGFEVGRDSLGA